MLNFYASYLLALSRKRGSKRLRYIAFVIGTIGSAGITILLATRLLGW